MVSCGSAATPSQTRVWLMTTRLTSPVRVSAYSPSKRSVSGLPGEALRFTASTPASSPESMME